MEEIIIKTAALSDVATLVSLGKETFYAAFAAQNSEADMQQYLAKTFTEEKLQEEMDEESTQFFLAYLQHKPVGYAKISSRQVPEALKGKQLVELERLYVLPEFQNRKTGVKLMEKCLQAAREKKAQIFWLGVWEQNEKALKFYHRIGFEKFGEHIFMLGTDAQTDFLLKLQLNN